MKSSTSVWPAFAGPAVTLALSFGWTSSLHSFKLLALASVAGFGLASIYTAFRKSAKFILTPASIISIVFVVSMSVTITFSSSPRAQQFYGVYGRNLGFLHYLFLLLVFLGVSTLDFKRVWPQVVKSLILVGIFEASYGALQFFGLDPLPWKNPDNWIFGTFGNPDYLSSFLALSSIATIYAALVTKKYIRKLYLLALVIFQSLVILFSSSSQGLILLSVGIFGFILIFSFSRSTILGLYLSILGFVMAFTGILGVFQIGPLRKYLYQDSISYRGDYWRAGIRMFQDNWIHGVGLDSYGDYYRMYRDTIAANRRGLDMVSNSAHNIFIDLAATGGILLLLSYFLILAITAFSILRVFKRSSSVSLEYKILVILWVAFNLQTMISINVPSLAIWGWIFSGLIFTYEYMGASSEALQTKHRSGRKDSVKFSTIISSVLCLVLVVPLINKDVRLANAFSRNLIPEITNALLIYPKDSDQIARVAIAYEKLGREKEALQLANKAIDENPNSSPAWRAIFDNKGTSQSEKRKASLMLKRLDPFSMLNKD